MLTELKATIRKCIYNVEKGKSSKQDEAQILAKVFGNGIVITYRAGISGVYGWENGQRKGKTRRAVIANYLNKQVRAGNDFKSRETSINEINQGSQAFSQNSVGEYMIPIENKIIFTDGNYDSPYVREIVEVLTEYQTRFEDIRERIYNVEKGRSDKYKTAQALAKVYGDGIVITYRAGISGVYGWENGQRKGKTRRAVIANYLNKQVRAGNDFKSRETPISEIAPIKETSSEDGVFF